VTTTRPSQARQTRHAFAKLPLSRGARAATAWASIAKALRAEARSWASSVGGFVAKEVVDMETGDCIA
jgi:hypothetical protein